MAKVIEQEKKINVKKYQIDAIDDNNSNNCNMFDSTTITNIDNIKLKNPRKNNMHNKLKLMSDSKQDNEIKDNTSYKQLAKDIYINLEISGIPISIINVVIPKGDNDYYKSIPRGSVFAISCNNKKLSKQIFKDIIDECMNQDLVLSRAFFVFASNYEELLRYNKNVKQNTLLFYIRFGHRDDNATFHLLYKKKFEMILYCKKILLRKAMSFTQINDLHNIPRKIKNIEFNNHLQKVTRKDPPINVIPIKTTRKDPPLHPPFNIKDSDFDKEKNNDFQSSVSLQQNSDYNVIYGHRQRYTTRCMNKNCKRGQYCWFVHNDEKIRCKYEAKHGICYDKDCVFLHGLSVNDYYYYRSISDPRILKGF